jgi:hypothetical protein
MIEETYATPDMEKKPIVWKCEKLYHMNNGINRVTFPKLFYIQCGESNPVRYCLCSTEYMYKDDEGFRNLTFYRFKIIENPENFFTSFEEFVDNDKEVIWKNNLYFYVDREATSAYPRTIYRVRVLKEGKYMVSPIYGRIYSLVFTDCFTPDCYPLPWKFYANFTRKNDKREYYFERSSPKPKPQIQNNVQYKIPDFALKLMLEGIIAKKELCPIIMDALTRENACITPCGHSFDYVALCKALEKKDECPTCRGMCKRESLVRL